MQFHFQLYKSKLHTESTYRNQHAVKVAVFFLVLVGIHCSQQLVEPLNTRDSQDGDAAVAAERLQQGEVDLQSHIFLVVSCQDTQHHIVWFPEGRKAENENCVS